MIITKFLILLNFSGTKKCDQIHQGQLQERIQVRRNEINYYYRSVPAVTEISINACKR